MALAAPVRDDAEDDEADNAADNFQHDERDQDDFKDPQFHADVPFDPVRAIMSLIAAR